MPASVTEDLSTMAELRDRGIYTVPNLENRFVAAPDEAGGYSLRPEQSSLDGLPLFRAGADGAVRGALTGDLICSVDELTDTGETYAG